MRALSRFRGLPAALVAALLALGACKPSPTRMVLDLTGTGAYFDLPHPSDLRLDAAGRAQLGDYPNPWQHPAVHQLKTLARTQVDGWSPSGTMYLRFTGPIDVQRLPADPAAYVSALAPVQLVDVDADSPERGRRFPIQVAMTRRGQTWQPKHLLQVLPVQGIELRPRTTYALILTASVPVPAGGSLIADASLHAVLRGQDPGGALGLRAVQVYRPLAAQLALEGRGVESIVAASVFTTGAPAERLERLAERVAELPVRRPEGPLRLLEERRDACVLEGEWLLPMFQNGRAPYLSALGGEFQQAPDGTPLVEAERLARLVVLVPKSRMPAEGFPLLQYVHGTGGHSSEVASRGGPGEVAAARGWAAAGTAGHLSVEHLGDAAVHGVLVYNLLNPAAMRDNFAQLVAEQILFRRLLRGLAIDPELCPAADVAASPDGRIRFDAGLQTLMGHSLGSMVAGLVAAVEPLDYQAVVLSASGASWIEFTLGVREPVDLRSLLYPLMALPPGETLDVWHPSLALFDLSVGGSNNLHFLGSLLRCPRPGHLAPHVLAIAAHEDMLMSAGVQRALVAALGVDLVGDEPAPTPDEQILPAIELAGRWQLAPPVEANVEVPGQAARTGAVVRYAPSSPGAGHDILWSLQAPKHQIGCFLQTLAELGTPVVVEGGRWDAPCF